ncbi:hypothetical protein B9G98_04551 [Wickerhamiella sorbophila]|uniref:Micro-fibrillar-associated protein 1 C-terminal domain-containing protein n=1 Tax=Wickerhamiella sorbophila TaxID=45607 RepID=A0A2T0FPL3_9ASCO|nr:hypothetical protein B9G98_04551 [Wickerhamiella sorbophila]PRT56931.1 hypothetical protein B9G98_04551 [Wickerhamiella sorbophila]
MSANKKRHFARKVLDPERSEESETHSSENEQPVLISEHDETVNKTITTEAAPQQQKNEETSSEDEFESEAESSDYSDDSEPTTQLSRPKFVRRNKPDTSHASAADTKQSTLELIERTVRAETQLNHTVDDTDGLDPTAEYEAWRCRAEARSQREYDRLAAIEQEYEERELAREREAKKPKLG